MMHPSSHYEIRLHRPGGKLSLVMLVPAASEADARERAVRMLKGDLTDAHILRRDLAKATGANAQAPAADQAIEQRMKDILAVHVVYSMGQAVNYR